MIGRIVLLDDYKGNVLYSLDDAISCIVTEERNDRYELEMVYPTKGQAMAAIRDGMLIAAPHDTTKKIQHFRICRIVKMLNGRVKVYAQHITYELNFVVVEPCTVSSAHVENVIKTLQTNAVNLPTYEDPDSDISTSHAYEVTEPTPLRKLLGGMEGSILDVWGGEYEFDNRKIILHDERGSDNGVTIRYAINMTDIRATIDSSDVFTGVLPYYKSLDGSVYIQGDVTRRAVSYPYDKIIPLDVSGEFQSTPSVGDINAYALSYVVRHVPEGPPLALDVSFVDLSTISEYNTLPIQSVKLCDLVTIYHEDFGINVKAKVIRTVYNVLTERYDSVTIGSYRKNLYDIYQQKATVRSGSIK